MIASTFKEKTGISPKGLSLLTGLLVAYITSIGAALETFNLGLLSNLGVINSTIDFVSMGVIFTLLLNCVADEAWDIRGRRVYQIVLTVGFSLFFWDSIVWSESLFSHPIIVREITHLFAYINTVLLIEAFWHYIVNLLDLRGDNYTFLTIVADVVTIVAILSIFLNMFFGFYYSIDKVTGTYIRSEWYWVSNVFPAIILASSTVVTIITKMDVRQKIILMSYCILPPLAMIVQSMYPDIALMYIMALVAMILVYGNIYSKREKNLAHQQVELANQKITVMVSQIKPHFLYNALTAIMNIKGNPPETKEAIVDFAKYLRGNLDTLSLLSPVPFFRELEHTENYVRLEILRFRNKLNVHYDIKTEKFSIPMLTLQVLVENAIKHGVTAKDDGGNVWISTYETPTHYVIEVKDDGVGFDVANTDLNDGKNHVGIASARSRLESNNKGTIEIISEVGVGTTATVKIPREDTN